MGYPKTTPEKAAALAQARKRGPRPSWSDVKKKLIQTGQITSERMAEIERKAAEDVLRHGDLVRSGGPRRGPWLKKP